MSRETIYSVRDMRHSRSYRCESHVDSIDRRPFAVYAEGIDRETGRRSLGPIPGCWFPTSGEAWDWIHNRAIASTVTLRQIRVAVSPCS